MRNFALLLSILLVATVLRFAGLNWDQGFHLHPDERFLTMVGVAFKTPQTFLEYLNPVVSTYNPQNVGFSFFVYGVFPLVLNKIIAIFLRNDTYELFTLQGRIMSGLMDLVAVLMVYKITEFFEKKYRLDIRTKFISAFLYATAVLPIQLSHFFAVDTFLNTFALLSVYFSLRSKTFLSALFFGLAFSSKITAVFALPLVGIFLIFSQKKSIKHIFSTGLCFLGTAYLVTRLANPYIFGSGNLFDPRLGKLFIDNLIQLKSFDDPNALFPPAVQWIGTQPFFYAVFNLFFFGFGAVQSLCALLGITLAFLHKKMRLLQLIAIWTLGIFLYQSVQYVKATRYFIMIYPYLAVFAGIGLVFVFKRVHFVVRYALLILAMACALMFVSIYTQNHTRVTASLWAYNHIPDHSIILSEYWDDALPLPVRSGRSFEIRELSVFEADTDTKWKKMSKQLKEADYYILSSNRGWGAIGRLPDRYPRMSKFYKDLFANKTSYKKVAEFHSYPSLSYLGIQFEISDQLADESFTVYDHPVVLIFEKQ